MQTGIVANRITTVAHSKAAVLPFAPNQIVVDDQRLRAWILGYDGDLTDAYPLQAILNGDGEIVRIRTLSNNTLEIHYATPADNLVFSSNTIVASALAGSGVALWGDGNEIDAFWFDANYYTFNIKASHSSDGGHTWGAASTVATLPAQGSDVLPQLCAPNQDTVIFTDSTVGLDADSLPMTALFLTVKISGTWITPVFWDLGSQHLGVEQPVTLPNGSSYPSNLSGVLLEDGRLEVSYYGQQLRETFEDGVWVQRIANVDYEHTTQHLHWSHPKEILQTIKIDDDNQSTQIFEAFPRLQRVGEEYWILALESSKFAGHERYYLTYHRSTDGIFWSDRDTHQGAASDDQVYAHCYDGDTPFLLTDLIYANLVVTDERTFIVGYDKVFYCPSTTLVGVTNPARQLDITNYTESWTVNQPAAPTTASANYNLQNVPKNWNDNDILAAHRGIRILHKAGYWTGIETQDEFVDIGQFWIDAVNANYLIGQNGGTVRGLDNTMLMDRWKSDVFYEWYGPQQLAYNQFCDLIPFNVIQGSFTTGGGGRLKSGVVNVSDNFRDDIAVLNTESADGFITYQRVRCDRTWDNNHMGFALQGQAQGDENDNKKFWAVLYGRKENRFTLNEAIPRPNSNRVKLYKYRGFVAESDEVVLNPSDWYWVRVANWHSHVMAWYCNDVAGEPDGNWILVIDFTSAATPATQVLPCRIGWQGLIGTQRVQNSGAVGNLNSSGAMQDLFSGSDPIMVATLVQLDNEPSILRKVNVTLTQENENQTPMPDAQILVISGDGSSPDDATDEDNVIYSGSPSALYFNAHDDPRGVRGNVPPNPALPKLSASEYIWVAATFNGTLSAGQSYKWASGGSGTSMVSTDGGATWSAAPACFTASVEVEYLNGRVKYHKMYYGTGENVVTYEDMAHHIAAKSGVLNIAPFDWLNLSEMTLEADSVYWQPVSYGKIGSLVLNANVTINEASLLGQVRVLLGSSQIAMGDLDAFVVELDPVTQKINFYTGSTLKSASESLQYIPTSFDLQIVNQNEFIYVYINECLASMWQNPDYGVPGYVGVDSVGVTWNSLRIPELYQVVDYWSIDARETALGSLQRLVSKPAPGAIARAKFFIRYDGSLRIGNFLRRPVVDTYQDVIININKAESTQYLVSDLNQSGNYYARATSPKLLDSDGRQFDERDSTDARTDRDAYAAGQQEFRDALEKTLTTNLEVNNPVWTLEREDVNTLISPEGQTSGNYIINDNTFSYSPSQSNNQSKQRTGYRTSIEE